MIATTKILLLASFICFVSSFQIIQSKYINSWSISSLQMAATTHHTESTYKPTTSGLASISSALNLPSLSRSDKIALANGERVQKQDRFLNAGRGLVVMDVKANKDDVFNLLKSFDRYAEIIPTVRNVNIYQRKEFKTSAEFKLSKFCLIVNVVHVVNPETHTITFSLDPIKPNLVLREAEGFWHLQSPPDRPEYTRVWFKASVVATRLLPTLLVDYAASKALPRATNWMQPYFLNQQQQASSPQA